VALDWDCFEEEEALKAWNRRADDCMKIWVFRTREWSYAGKERDFPSLEECLKTLEKETGFDQFVISKPREWQDYIPKGIKVVVEIYDTYRE